MSGFNMPPGVSPSDIHVNDVSDVDIDEGDHQAIAVMTLRDVFAVAAMHAIINATSHGLHSTRPDMSIDESMTRDAYTVADAMLKARAQ